MTVKAIRHHQSFAGRDADDAHAQYLRLSNPSMQTMAGSLNLGDSMLYAGYVVPGTIISREYEDLIIKACDTENNQLILMGSCGENSPVPGNIYLKTAFNRDSCRSGNILLLPGTGGKIYMCSDTFIGIETTGELQIEADCFCGYFESFILCASDFKVEGDEICLMAGDGSVSLDADDIYLNGKVTVNGNLESCCLAKFSALLLCCTLTDVILSLHYNGNLGESYSPMIGLDGCCCDDYDSCASLWIGGSTGKNQAKYCLDGGIFINVNGCHRYIKFHRPLP